MIGREIGRRWRLLVLEVLAVGCLVGCGGAQDVPNCFSFVGDTSGEVILSCSAVEVTPRCCESCPSSVMVYKPTCDTLSEEPLDVCVMRSATVLDESCEPVDGTVTKPLAGGSYNASCAGNPCRGEWVERSYAFDNPPTFQGAPTDAERCLQALIAQLNFAQQVAPDAIDDKARISPAVACAGSNCRCADIMSETFTARASQPALVGQGAIQVNGCGVFTYTQDARLERTWSQEQGTCRVRALDDIYD
uniref:Uncharacterized protein n=1 Tax=Erythrolobus australicus TaxID=1077150 RepID=A0A7S1TKU9_9RHOD